MQKTLNLTVGYTVPSLEGKPSFTAALVRCPETGKEMLLAHDLTIQTIADYFNNGYFSGESP